MASRTRFCWILPLSQVSLAALIGGFGLWQRNKVLSHGYLFGIVWDTTLRFHVWPWPFICAAGAWVPSTTVYLFLGRARLDRRRMPNGVCGSPSFPTGTVSVIEIFTD